MQINNKYILGKQNLKVYSIKSRDVNDKIIENQFKELENNFVEVISENSNIDKTPHDNEYENKFQKSFKSTGQPIKFYKVKKSKETIETDHIETIKTDHIETIKTKNIETIQTETIQTETIPTETIPTETIQIKTGPSVDLTTKISTGNVNF